MLKKYTVVLLRPDYIAEPYGIDTYTALVEGEGYDDAIKNAQKEVFKADKRDGMWPSEPDDYALVVMFEGHMTPCLYGWQV